MEFPKVTQKMIDAINKEMKEEEERLSKELHIKGFEELDRIIDSLKKEKKISISYIQRNFSYGFTKSGRIFKWMVGKYIEEDGTVIKETVYQHFNDTYKSGLNIIFLDVDGVLNCRTTKDKCGPYIGIDDQKVILLKELVEATNAKIVLVSTWKEWWFKRPKLKDMQDDLANYLDNKLAKQGLEIWDKTDDDISLYRGEGIIEYLNIMNSKGNHIDNYVIIDDELFDYKKQKLTPHLVRTSFEQDGLQRKHIKKAVELLSK